MEKSRDTPPGAISFYVHATPKGKGRPRFSQDRLGGVHTYTPNDLNGLAYHDDAQLVEMKGTKSYDAIEGVRVTIYPA